MRAFKLSKRRLVKRKHQNRFVMSAEITDLVECVVIPLSVKFGVYLQTFVVLFPQISLI